MDFKEGATTPIRATWQKKHIGANERVSLVLGKGGPDDVVVAATNAKLRYKRIFEAEIGKAEPDVDVKVLDEAITNLDGEQLNEIAAILRREIPDSQHAAFFSPKSRDPEPGVSERIIHVLGLPVAKTESREIVLKGNRQVPESRALEAFHRTRKLQILVQEKFPQVLRDLISIVPIYAQIEYFDWNNKRMWQLMPYIDGRRMSETKISDEEHGTYDSKQHAPLLKALVFSLKHSCRDNADAQDLVPQLQRPNFTIATLQLALEAIANAYGGYGISHDLHGDNIIIDDAGHYHLIDR